MHWCLVHCHGMLYAYGNMSHITQGVTMNSFIITFQGFMRYLIETVGFSLKNFLMDAEMWWGEEESSENHLVEVFRQHCVDDNWNDPWKPTTGLDLLRIWKLGFKMDCATLCLEAVLILPFSWSYKNISVLFSWESKTLKPRQIQL